MHSQGVALRSSAFVHGFVLQEKRGMCARDAAAAGVPWAPDHFLQASPLRALFDKSGTSSKLVCKFRVRFPTLHAMRDSE